MFLGGVDNDAGSVDASYSDQGDVKQQVSRFLSFGFSCLFVSSLM